MAGSESEPANSSSGEEEEEEEVSSDGSESESESKKPRSKNPTTRYSPPPLKQPTGKRPAAEVEPADPKRVRKKMVVAVAAPDADNGGEKKTLFQRLWSEENEIELIQGMINYVNEKGKDPVADVVDFHEFVNDSLHVDVNNRQVITKVRRLKKKYKNNVAKAENQGKVRSFSNPHEKIMYELSKTLWGNDSNKNVVMSLTTKKVNVTPKPNKNRKIINLNGGVEVKPEVSQVNPNEVIKPNHGSMGFVITDESIMNKGLELLSGPKKAEMEEKWRNLKVEELKLFLKKVEFLKEQGEIVLNAMVKSGDN